MNIYSSYLWCTRYLCKYIKISLTFVNFRLSWSELNGSGWHIEICGGKRSLDMSALKFERKETGPLQTKQIGLFFPELRTFDMGPQRWLLTPKQEPNLGRKYGARLKKPPMLQVTEYLETLRRQGCEVVASNLTECKVKSPLVFVWTLNQGKLFFLAKQNGYFIIEQ